MIDLSSFDEVTDEVLDDFNLTSSSSSSSKRREHYFIMRLPYDMNIADLNGATINKSAIVQFISDRGGVSGGASTAKAMKKDVPLQHIGTASSSSSSRKGSSEHYEINLVSAEPYNTFRPIVKDELSRSLKVGDPFLGALSITSAASIPALDVSTITVPTAYSKKEQVKGLKVRSVPPGSQSTVADIHERKSKFEAMGAAGAASRSPGKSPQKKRLKT